MYDVRFYVDKRGREPVAEYMKDLAKRKDKDSKIRLKKIRECLQALQEKGTFAGEPYMKHIEGEIWELRPASDRIFFAAWIGNCFVLLHYFVKKTQKTPRQEIEKAKRELEDLREREH